MDAGKDSIRFDELNKNSADQEISRERLYRLYAIIESLSSEYHTIWIVDKDTLKMHLIRSTGVSTIKGAVKIGQDIPDFDSAFAKYIDTYVEPQDRERMRHDISSEEVLKQIERMDLYSVNYLRRDESGNVGYHQIAFANADRGEGIRQFVCGFRDVDKLVREENARRQEVEKQLDIIGTIAKAYNAIYYVDMSDFTFVELGANLDGVRQIIGTGGKSEEAFERMYKYLIHPDFVDEVREFTDLTTLNERLKDRDWISHEFCGPHGDWSEGIFIAANRDENGNCEHAIWATRDIDRGKKREQKLIHQSTTDELTGLFNRRCYETDLKKYNNTAPKNFVYVSIDINGLKVVNDNIGHEAGDELITGAAKCISQCIGPYGRLYRIGGDEFAALITADDEQVETIRRDIEKQTAGWKGRLVEKLSMSCGFAAKKEFPRKSVHQLILLADKRMYEAKSGYYRSQGVDRRGQRDAHTALCALYTKILKINITEDTYQIINMNDDERSADMGFADSISKWLRLFGTSGQVHPYDLKEYLEKTDLSYISSYFKDNKTSLSIFYRRKYGDVFKQVMMEIIPANDYSDDQQTLFLYVKNIDR